MTIDIFSVKIISNCVPILQKSRQHHEAGLSQYLVNGHYVFVANKKEL